MSYTTLKKVQLEEKNITAYRRTEFAESDRVYAIIDGEEEGNEQIGIVFLSEESKTIHIDWLEIFTPFRTYNYLRSIIRGIYVLHPKTICLETSTDNLKKFLAIGCKILDMDEFTKQWSLKYSPEFEKEKTEEEDTVMSDQKMYVYDCYNGDRGIIFAPTYDEAKLLFLQDYPERTIVSSFDDYYGYSDAAYLYKSDELKRNTLFKIFSA